MAARQHPSFDGAARVVSPGRFGNWQNSRSRIARLPPQRAAPDWVPITLITVIVVVALPSVSVLTEAAGDRVVMIELSVTSGVTPCRTHQRHDKQQRRQPAPNHGGPGRRAGAVAGEGAGADAVLRADPVLAAGAGRSRAGYVRGGRQAPVVRRLQRGGSVVRAGERRGVAARVRAPVPGPRRPRRRQGGARPASERRGISPPTRC